MSVLSFASDPAGRLIVEVYVGLGSDDMDLFRFLGQSIPVPRVLRALIDTGSSHTLVDLDILTELGSETVGTVETFTASTGLQAVINPIFMVRLDFAGDFPAMLRENWPVTGSRGLKGLNVEMLLGRDILDEGLLVDDGMNRRFSFAYNKAANLSGV